MIRERSTGLAIFLAIALVASSSSMGCTKTLQFDASELEHLNGYNVRNEREVPVTTHAVDAQGNPSTVTTNKPVADRPFRMLSREGEPFSYTSDASLFLVNHQWRKKGGRLEFFSITEKDIHMKTLKGDEFELALEDVSHAEAQVDSPGRTIALAVVITVGLTVLPFLLDDDL
jgi:hypothetical protein